MKEFKKIYGVSDLIDCNFPCLRFDIAGEPEGKQSARHKVVTDRNGNAIKKFTASGKSKFSIHSYQPKKSESFTKWVQWSLVAQRNQQHPKGFNLWYGPVWVTKLHYIFAPPKSFGAFHKKQIEEGMIIFKDTKPDVQDNLNKAVFDAMEKIIIYTDSQIVAIDNLKKYYGKLPGIKIEMYHILAE